MGKIVMPKNSALLDEIAAVLKIYFEAGGWISNDEYKTKLKSLIGDDQYASSYTKKAQITSYFGFTIWRDISSPTSERKITELGKRMYVALQNKDNQSIQEVIMESLETVTFGRNNYGCPDSNSDIEPPSLFIRASLDIGYLTYKEFAFLLWKVEDVGDTYTDALIELKNYRANDNLTLNQEATKYSDCKPIMILLRWGFLAAEDDSSNPVRVIVDPEVLEKYGDRLKNLKIYNVDKDGVSKNFLRSIDDIKDEIVRLYKQKNYDIASINSNYNDFKSLFGPEALSSLSGKDLLLKLFAPKDVAPGGLIYHLEHDPKYGGYGGIGAGSSFVYPLFYSSKKKSWITGSSKKPKLIDEDEAILIATSTRDKLVNLCSLVDKYKEYQDVNDYLSLEKEIYSGDTMFVKIWVFKYLHLIYPKYFSTFYNANWINKEIKNLQIEEKGGLYTKNGQISLFANELGIPNVCFAWLLYEIFPSTTEDNAEDENDNLEERHMLPKIDPRTYFGHSLNTIIYGAPGTGKTYSTIEYALSIVEKRDINHKNLADDERKQLMDNYQTKVESGEITFTTFHQNYSYEDFIQGLRPDTNGDGFKFVTVDGVFKKIADKAMENPNHNYVLIIDEINRANISKVLGELITLIEEDKRWGELNQLSVTLPSGDVFAVPNNLYIIGTMNTADKSISLIDVALRRRFDFIEQKVDYSLVLNPLLKKVLLSINNTLADEFESTDLLIGHAYFIGKSEDDFISIMNKKIIPLLYEYYSDNSKKVESLLNDALKETGFELCSSKNERLRIKKTEELNA